MNVLTAKSLDKIISKLREELSIYAGAGDDTRVLISKGSKIKDKDNINYTVTDVNFDGQEVIVKCVRPANPAVMPDTNIEISLTGKELKDFELV